jgi:hypothetical protein
MRAAALVIGLVALTTSLVTSKTLKELTDKSFEHDTQATTGGTTGDWFVRFCEETAHCSTKNESFVAWGKLADKLNRRVSVAYVDL